jgi:hypothetical protein
MSPHFNKEKVVPKISQELQALKDFHPTYKYKYSPDFH